MIASAKKHVEPHSDISSGTMNWLRAAVLGANDGIVSVAALVVGVAGASNNVHFIFTAGIAGLMAGALSMAVGEYVSVSTQRDTERALLEKEKWELENEPEKELEELAHIYEGKGISAQTAKIVAQELTAHDALAAHAEVELGIDPHDLTNPLQAAYASGASFTVGALIPLIAIILSSEGLRIPITFASVLIALSITGTLSAYAGGANKTRATIRVVVGGMIAMAITFGIGKLFDISSM